MSRSSFLHKPSEHDSVFSSFHTSNNVFHHRGHSRTYQESAFFYVWNYIVDMFRHRTLRPTRSACFVFFSKFCQFFLPRVYHLTTWRNFDSFVINDQQRFGHQPTERNADATSTADNQRSIIVWNNIYTNVLKRLRGAIHNNK